MVAKPGLPDEPRTIRPIGVPVASRTEIDAAGGVGPATSSSGPLGAPAALRLGLIDRVLARCTEEFRSRNAPLTPLFAALPTVHGRIVAQKAARKVDERSRSPAACRADEPAVMRRQFFAPRAAVC
ncbi:hypothetical protein [Kitasatospora sp. CB02891]|uniref:hypothetical protein n=1 Tax=Kitasatospora sp. CB02891 TaxID=2020329 RepID=UPI0012FDA491|nr:hypothetical protein [Kitasatospora sp. CB02891]